MADCKLNVKLNFIDLDKNIKKAKKLVKLLKEIEQILIYLQTKK